MIGGQVNYQESFIDVGCVNLHVSGGQNEVQQLSSEWSFDVILAVVLSRPCDMIRQKTIYFHRIAQLYMFTESTVLSKTLQ